MSAATVRRGAWLGAAALVALVALPLVALPLAAQQKQKHERPPSGDSARKPYVPRPLFASTAPLAITITADYGAVFKDRDTLRTRRHPATLAFVDERGAPATLPIELSTRGHFRLKPTTCGFPPLRVVFDKSKTKGTPFAGQRALKLVTHCRNGDRAYEQYVLREYLVYKTLNALTDRSFRDRLARVTYVDPANPAKAVTAYGYFVESEDELAARLGGRVLTAKNGRFDDFDAPQMDLVSVFEYFIGNTDWSIGALHNMRIVATDGGDVYPVPYDFDWSGIVHTHYALPDPHLPIKSVRERLYRGPCRTAAQLAPTFALFRERRDSIVSLYRSLPGLDRDYVKDTEAYIADFYDVIGDARQWKFASDRACEVGN